jgi:FMN phosphatase YigB (HAD superfamily)
LNTRSLNFGLAGVKLVSFDVFDTVVARRCGAPANLFRILAEKLRARETIALSPVAFELARSRAEQRARYHKGGRDVCFAEIYEELNSLWRLPQPVVQDVMNLELEAERENLFAIPGALSMVQAAREAKKRVVFTSDMYLPEDFLRATLVQLGLLEERESLYVSSRWGRSKADGGLYQVLLEKETLAPDEVLHIGDSYHVDYLNSRKAGLRAIRLDRGPLNRFEAALATAEASASENATRLAGIARRARLEMDLSGRQTIAARLGASVAGPLLTLYSEWVLRTAIARGIKRLYFLARDGEALMELCEALAPSLGADHLRLHYLYGSRQTWYPAVLVRCDEPAADFFASTVAFNRGSWQQCVEYLGLDPSSPTLKSLASKWARWKPSCDAKRALFLEVISHPEIGPVVRDFLSRQTQLLWRYLKEVGLMDHERCALVDCGWSGTWTDILSDVITAHGGRQPEVFFLGRRHGKVASRAPTSAYLFDHQSGTGLEKIPEYFHIVVEFALTANHGRTKGFQESGGRLVPELAQTELQGFTVEEWEVFRNSLVRFAELYAEQGNPQQAVPDLRSVLVGCVSLLWEHPSTGEAELLGRHTIGLSPVKLAEKALARAYGYVDILRLVFRLRLPGYPPYWWHEGAQAISPFGPRVSMAVLWETRELVRKLAALSNGGIRMRSLAQAGVHFLRKLKWQLLPLSDKSGPVTEKVAPEEKPDYRRPVKDSCFHTTSPAPVIVRSE